MIEITREPIDIEEVVSRVRKSANGAVVTFAGTVRDNSEGKRVLYLEYDAYPEMAEKKLGEIAREIQARWGTKDVAISHRIGRLELGEISVVIAVGSPHRQEAFQACQYAIDHIKEMVPIWKKEFYQDGSAWIGHG
ncbi:MAG: molybdenum cofactor biosynthesis protein MoaE [Chloroflexota bacterium]